MIIFYSILIALCVYMELSSKINTDNIINKIGILLVILGALLAMYNACYALPHDNNLIAFGAFLYFICELRFSNKHNRRMSDRVES